MATPPQPPFIYSDEWGYDSFKKSIEKAKGIKQAVKITHAIIRFLEDDLKALRGGEQLVEEVFSHMIFFQECWKSRCIALTMTRERMQRIAIVLLMLPRCKSTIIDDLLRRVEALL